MNAEERRRYFRINDSVGVAYRKLGPEEAKAFVSKQGNSNTEFDYVSNFDNRIQTLLDACQVQSPVAAELIDLINKKLNFVIRQLDIDSEVLQNIAYDLKQVNVSACGMAFATAEPLDKGDLLQMDVVLQPTELHLVIMAEVVACDRLEGSQPDDAYFLRLNFVELRPDDQELLIQHVVKRQGALLKSRREGLEEQSDVSKGKVNENEHNSKSEDS